MRVASDIGGTFTDVVLDNGKRQFTTKVLTTPRAPEEAVLTGVAFVLDQAGLAFSDIALFLHGTTLATNAIIERKGARTALLATEGFRDILDIADESRFDQYDVFIEKPVTLVPRSYRYTVAERLDVNGAVLLELDEAAVARIAGQLVQAGIEAVAIAFIHAYVNPAHELRAAEILRERCPDLAITLSSEVCPEAREYERTSTAVANAFVQPLMAGYLRRLADCLAAQGYLGAVHLMTSGGSLASLETARRFPIRLVESGPAGGAILAAELAGERGENQILSFDMGGTTAKICLIEGGRPLKARSFEVDRMARFLKGSGLPIRIPVIEMIEIGAGGGSIAQVDALARIQVGPQSAGSEPGPACYARGGMNPTVTDADVCLGKVDPARFAGGRLKIDRSLADEAVQRTIGSALNLNSTDAAFAVAEIVDENMANAARVHAIERGIDVSARTLVAFGGAAPLHAARLAEKLHIERVIVPSDAGVGSAIGFLRAPVAYEMVRSRYMRLEAMDVDAANALLQDMRDEALGAARSAAGEVELVEERGAFMRYAGQGHEILVTLPTGTISKRDAETLRSRFEVEYTRLYKRHIPDAGIEIMSWFLAVSTRAGDRAILAALPPGRCIVPTSSRPVFDASSARQHQTPVIDRDELRPGDYFDGPAVVVEAGTSTIVSSRFDVHVDAGLALVLTARKDAP